MSVCANRLVLNLRGAIDRVRSQNQPDWSTEGWTNTTGAATIDSDRVAVCHDAMELQPRPCPRPAHGYDYRGLDQDGQTPSSPLSATRTLYRPRSTTVVEVVTGSDVSTFSDVVPGDYHRKPDDGSSTVVSLHSDISEMRIGIAV